MTKEQPWKDEGLTKAEWIEREVAAAVSAGKAWDLETVDFSDPNRPLTCLEVDFPIVPINSVAALEGKGSGGLKPVYQVSKWWARRRTNVFRSMILAAATKAPDDPSEAARLVWDAYYGNHQEKDTFKHLKVADIFMGGGTTVVEGSRLGMQMYGNDLNPVAWFVVKNELAQVDKAEVENLLADIEAEVKPQIMPFYACDCPRGHKGKWIQTGTGTVMGDDFDPLALTPEQRREYSYDGPEVIYTFWAKHGPCPVTSCEHRTPVMTSPVVAAKTVSIKTWKRCCAQCQTEYDLEAREIRLAPGVELAVADSEPPYAIASLNLAGTPESANCPHCDCEERFGILPAPTNKKISMTLAVHPVWMAGEAANDETGAPFGGSVRDSADSTIRWNRVRSQSCKLVEIRGDTTAPVALADGETVVHCGSDADTALGRGMYRCAACGTESNLTKSIARTESTAPVASYAIQGHCSECEAGGDPLGGRFFAPATDTRAFDAAMQEWSQRCEEDLAEYWPRNSVPIGTETHPRLPDNGYDTWSKFFNERQLLILTQLLRSIVSTDTGTFSWLTREYVLSAYQQYIRNQNMFCFWNIQRALEPHFSNNNYYPKFNPIENSVFSGLGRGDWTSCCRFLNDAQEWRESPWELVSKTNLTHRDKAIAKWLNGNSHKVQTGDPVQPGITEIGCKSATDLAELASNSVDIVITDPPFGGLMQYAEMADFFYSWLRLVLQDKYPEVFSAPDTPKAVEAVSNRVRHGNDSEEFYQRALTSCWTEANRILKPGGILAFTFHHSADEPWVAVLESLFDAGFYLEATYPIRGDETKGAGQFGSKLIEYDIIHVCRKRIKAPNRVSWAKLRQRILQDIRSIQELLQHHQERGLPEADLQVIRRGKALEYFSRHYGQVYKTPETPMSVLEALLGINQLLDEEAGGVNEPPPHNAEPFTRMMLRLFDGVDELPRDQMQKFLRGTGSAPSDFIGRGWVTEKKKVFYLVPPLDIAREWVGKQRRGMTSDYDQAMYLIGACFENSGIIATDTLNNANFRPHPALGAILTWFKTHGADSPTRNAAITASQLYKAWEAKNQPKAKELTLFDMLGEDD